VVHVVRRNPGHNAEDRVVRAVAVLRKSELIGLATTSPTLVTDGHVPRVKFAVRRRPAFEDC
jgi:hypothetical protein